MNPDIPQLGPAFPDFADARFKNAVVQIGRQFSQMQIDRKRRFG
jgi:hypothetical protein